MKKKFPNRVPIKWKAVIALSLIVFGTIFNWYWVWGILYLFWAIIDLVYQETHLIERVTKAENPILYWFIVIVWFVLSIFSFFPSYQ